MERKWEKIIGVIFISFFFVFVFVQPSLAADFKIGYCVPITGGMAKPGAANIRGATLAVKEINAAGGMSGLKLELLTGDSKCVPTEGINVAERFVEKDKVDVLMGEVCSSTTIAILEVVKRTKKPLVVTTSTAPEITASTAPTKGYVFRLVPTNDLLSAQLAEALIDKMKFNKISLITDVGNEWSVTLRNLFKKHMEKRGLQPLSEESIQPGETDFYSVISKVKAVKPAAVFANMQGVELVNFTRQANESGLKTQLFSGQAASDPATQKAMGGAMEGMIFLSFYEPTNLDNPVSVKFTQGFQKEYSGVEPGIYDAQPYDGIYFIADAIKRAGGDKTKFLESMKNTKNLQGIIGLTTFDENGQAQKRVLLVKMEGGKKVILK